MCVSHRHLDRLMPHQFRYRAKIHTGHHQAARERMPQAVPGKEADASLAKCRVKPVLVALQLLPLHINKNSALPHWNARTTPESIRSTNCCGNSRRRCSARSYEDFRDFAAAEYAVQQALIAAAGQWPQFGVPENPRGWLIQGASRRMADQIRSEVARRHREQVPAEEALTRHHSCHPVKEQSSPESLRPRGLQKPTRLDC
jgi:hypothetical protein